MAAYADLQAAEFAAEKLGYAAVKHQSFVGTGYFDLLAQKVGGGVACAVCACVLCMCVCVLFVRLLCVSRASFQTIINFCLCCAFVAPSAWRRAFPPS